MIQAFAPFVIKAKGTIINITSVAGHLHVPWISTLFRPTLTFEKKMIPVHVLSAGVYAAPKQSLDIINEIVRLEMALFGVTVLTVTNGGVKSTGQSHFDS